MSKFYYGTEEHARFDLKKAQFVAEAVAEKLNKEMQQRVARGDTLTTDDFEFFAEVAGDARARVSNAQEDVAKYDKQEDEENA